MNNHLTTHKQPRRPQLTSCVMAMMERPQSKVDNETVLEPAEPRLISSSSADSLTTTMAEGAELMREQDAEILEQGFVDSCSTGETPILAPVVASPPGSFDMSLPPVDGCDSTGSFVQRSQDVPESTTITEGCVHNVEMPNPLPGGLPSEYCTENVATTAGSSSPLRDKREIHMDTIGLDRIDPSLPVNQRPRVVLRRCLSGEDRAYQSERSQRDLEAAKMKGGSPISVTDEVIQPPSTVSSQSTVQQPSENPPSTMLRSKSHQRLISEVAQFAEAVGEMPPLSESEVKQIIEESGSESGSDDDDSDDNANEVRVDDQAMIPSLSPQKSAGHRTMSLLSFQDNSETSIVHDAGENIKMGDEHDNSRLRWPFKPKVSGKRHSFLHKLPDGVDSEVYHYKGIHSNPPEITKRGISRGNYAQLHRKAWLEVSDKYHRYGKNLRLYYKHWETLDHPTNMFFDWLDSKGEAAGEPLPNLPECPRSQLDSDTVLYITNEEMQGRYEIGILPDEEGRALLVDIDSYPVRTGVEGWIFVLRDHKLYAAEKVTSITGVVSKQRFHHSSFFGGKAVAAAGIIITDENGYLSRFYPHSGHYRPGEAHMQRMLFHLHHSGVDLRTFDVDTQQILHVARKDVSPKGGQGVLGDTHGAEKKKKIHSLHLKPAVYVACFLAHKARLMGEGVFSQIHKIRKSSAATVTEALNEVDEGGYWKKLRCELVG